MPPVGGLAQDRGAAASVGKGGGCAAGAVGICAVNRGAGAVGSGVAGGGEKGEAGGVNDAGAALGAAKGEAAAAPGGACGSTRIGPAGIELGAEAAGFMAIGCPSWASVGSEGGALLPARAWRRRSESGRS